MPQNPSLIIEAPVFQDFLFEVEDLRRDET